MKFIEERPIEQGFAALFDTQLKPSLMVLEGERRKRLFIQRLLVWPTFLIPVAIALFIVAGFVVAGSEDKDLIIASVILLLTFALFVPLLLRKVTNDAWAKHLGVEVMPVICAHFPGMRYQKNNCPSFPLKQMEKLGVVAKHNKVEARHYLSGHHKDVAFEILEADLFNKLSQVARGGRSDGKVFSGLLIHFSLPKEAPGKIVIWNDRGSWGNKLDAHAAENMTIQMRPVPFDDANFEKAFEVYSDTVTGTQMFLNSAFRTCLVSIAQIAGGIMGSRVMNAGFEGRSFFLELRRTEKLIKMGPLNQPIDQIDRVIHQIFGEIDMIFDLGDHLLKATGNGASSDRV